VGVAEKVARTVTKVAEFESYLRLDGAVRSDRDLRKFLVTTHDRRRDYIQEADTAWPTDLVFLATPDLFAQALLHGRAGQVQAGAVVIGGVRTALATEALWETLKDWVTSRNL